MHSRSGDNLTAHPEAAGIIRQVKTKLPHRVGEMGHPRSFTPCTWLTTLNREDLIERAGAVSAAKLCEIDDALRASEQTAQWTPAAVARLSEIKDSVRRRAQADGEGTDAHTSEGRSRSDDRRSVAAQQQDHDLRLEY